MRSTLKYYKGSDGRLRRITTYINYLSRYYRLKVFAREVKNGE